jgi:hypothetical protein
MAFVTIYRNMREKNKETEGTKETEEKKGL